ncbi:hypothetical protein [Methanosarcina sp.]|uniref:hypothetical protein n=1 Tax=Methanosarcina sp. TaxID=2213 RepID=UPI002B5A9E35|nr:hypothetical protein [Methanosarcina sp.]HOW15058.1 hypothetical protein [Methanosarcina sp.]
MEQTDDSVNVGGPEYDSKDDYIKSLANLFYKINGAADCRDKSQLVWLLDYYVDILINRMIDPNDREAMREAKNTLFEVEQDKELKKERQKTKEKSILSVDGRQDASIATNKIIFGELITYFDRYYGFETQLAVML